MKVVITGGHLTPALAVIEALPKNTDILFVGRKYAFEGDKNESLEYKVVKSFKIKYKEIIAGRLQRKFTKYSILSLLKFPIGIVQSLIILFKFKPDMVVGFGGYVSLPVAIASYILNIPVVIHEQTLEAGMANKILSPIASKICISWESSRQFFPKEKTILTGNPVRKFDVRCSKFEVKVNKELPTIYITGGSSGSHFINKLVEGCIDKLLQKYNIIHQAGDSKFNDFDRLISLRSKLPKTQSARYHIVINFDPSIIGTILSNSNLVVGRAGMNTITELIYFRKPAILIPIPFSSNNEQLKNAKFLESLGLGKVLNQTEIDSDIFYKEINSTFDNIYKYKLKKDKEYLMLDQGAINIVKTLEYVYKNKKEKKE